jgi:phospholipid N-methyltransferase
MKPRKSPADTEDKDVIDHLGEFIEENFRKGMSKMEEIFKDEEGDEKTSYLKVLMDDKNVAAVAPSSKFLVERAVKAMDLKHAKTIIEYGAAQGVMTKQILQKMPADARLLAIELNDHFLKDLKRMSDPRLLIVRGDVREIDKIAQQHGFGPVDVILSGIPFSYLSNRGRHELLAKTSDLLHTGGRFVVSPQYTTHLIPLFKDYFRDFETQFELRNLPPSFIFTAVK